MTQIQSCFHAVASKRKKTNFVGALKSEEGIMVSNHEELCNLLRRYYTQIFEGTNHTTVLPEFENKLQVTDAQNDMLTATLSFEEFTAAVKSMHPDKASGPDGLNPAFFQHFWKLLGNEVYQCCKQWLEESKFSAGVNDTTLVLIPKKDVVEECKDLRPIALCNVLYKIVAKVLANRLQQILLGLITRNNLHSFQDVRSQITYW